MTNNGKHTDGKHDDLYPHGTKHAKHDKDATFAYQIVQTDRSFVYDDAGKLLSATETEDNYGTYTYTYEYDLMGNRTAVYKTDSEGEVVESEEYSYNESNQVIKVALYDGKKNTTITYTYDEDGNRISEIGKIGTDKVEKYYEYTVENRLAAVYEKEELLMAAAYDGDGNRVFQLNYNPEAEGHCRTDCGYAWNEEHKGADNKSSDTQKGDDRTATYENGVQLMHLYYGNRTGIIDGKTVAALDLDDVTGYGPETVTLTVDIGEIGEGIFNYSVHDYSSGSSISSTRLSYSNAVVRVYNGNELVETYVVPQNEKGTVWLVFSLSKDGLQSANEAFYSASASGVR